MNMQRRADERSASLHKEIAKKLRMHRELWDIPRQNIIRWKKRRGSGAPAINEWENIFNVKSREEILSILEGNNEESVRLRSSSPFTGILNENERMMIFGLYNRKEYKKG